MQDCILQNDNYTYKKCRKNPPGLLETFYTFKDWVLTYPDKDDYPTTGNPNTVSNPVVLDTTTFPDAKFWSWQGAPERYKFNSKTDGERGSKYLTSTITQFIPGNSALFSWLAGEALNEDLILIFRYKNRHLRLMGDLDFPADLDYEEDSGEKRGDTAGYLLTFTVPIHDDPFAYYTSTIPT